MQTELKRDETGGLLPWIERFLVCRPRLSRLSRRTYRFILIGFLPFLDKASLQPGCPLIITQDTVARWLRSLSVRVSRPTLEMRLVPVRRFLSYLEGEKVLREDPFRVLHAQYPRKGYQGIAWALTGDCPQKELETLASVPRFSSPLGASLQNFLTFERALGKVF